MSQAGRAALRPPGGPRHRLTEQLVGRGGGEVKLLLQILPQEGSEAGHHRDLHAGGQDDAREHRVGEQVLGDLGDHCRDREAKGHGHTHCTPRPSAPNAPTALAVTQLFRPKPATTCKAPMTVKSVDFNVCADFC